MGFQTWVDLVILDMLEFDIILGMNWLSLFYDVLKYNSKTLIVDIQGIDKLEYKGVYKFGLVKIISFFHVKKFVGKG